MNVVAERHQSQLKPIKKCVEDAMIYFKENNDRFHSFQKFVFQTALTSDDENALSAAGKPIIEFNLNNAFLSRFCGEFAEQEPSIMVEAENGMPVDPQVIEVVDGHIRHIMFDANKRNTQYSVFKDQTSGGFSSFKMWTEYAHAKSFDQVLKVGRSYEPTLVGFDPSAREATKSDGEFCFEIYPMSKENFKRDYPEIDISDINFEKEDSSFSWAYFNEKMNVIVVCDFYKKKKKKIKILKLADDSVKTEKEYEDILKEWELSGRIEQPPVIQEERWTSLQNIVRYRLIKNKIIKYEKTIFDELPLVYADGDSVTIKENDSGTYKQFTKPYVYHTKGIQRLINFSGQVIGNDFENLTMHKFMVAKESIPEEEEWMEAYRNPQIASVMVYNQYMPNEPDKQLNPPREVARVGLPQEVVAIFNNGIQIMQSILGSHDAAIGGDNKQFSGKAMEIGSINASATAKPYIVAYMQALNQIANNIVSVIPKLYKTPRTIPIMNKDGERSFVKVNQEGGVSFNYDENALSVRVEAGPSTSIQKSQALEQIAMIMKVSPVFAQFMSEEGLPFILDNIEFRGADELADKAKQWLVEFQKKQAQQPNPEMIKMQLAQQKQQSDQMEHQTDTQLKAMQLKIDQQQVHIDQQRADNERADLQLRAGESKDQLIAELSKSAAEERRAEADMHLKHKEVAHKHLHEAIRLHHDINQSEKENEKGKE